MLILTVVHVPVIGYFRDVVFASPSKVFSLVQRSKIRETVLRINLLRQEWCDEPQDISVNCNSSRLSVNLSRPNVKEDNNIAGTISIKLRNSISPGLIETSLSVSYKIKDVSKSFKIPVKILVIDRF